jgi:head-tail adaptor
VIPLRLLRTGITVLRAAKVTDRYGTVTLDWANPTRTDMRAEVQPRSSSENEAGRSLEVIDAVVYLRPDVDLKASDRVQIGGVIYRVVGPPQQVKRLGRPHHLIANLTSAEG